MLKHLVSRLLLKAGYRLVPCDVALLQPMKLEQRPFNVLDFIVLTLIEHRKPFFFVQIGANNGVRFDPLRKLVLRHQLPGLLVEPLPDLFEELRSNYASQSQLRFERSALSATARTQIIYRVRKDCPFGDWAHGIASFNYEHLVRHLSPELDDFEKYIEKIEVPCTTARQLIAKYRIDNISLLQVDTEGYDYEVLSMFLGESIRPDVINFERVHLPIDAQLKSRQLLKSCGYRFIDVASDTLAITDELSDSYGKFD